MPWYFYFERKRVSVSGMPVEASLCMRCQRRAPDVCSILDSTAAAVVRLKARRALILGTPVTMKSTAYPNTLRPHGIEALPRLSDEEIAALEKLLDLELYHASPVAARETILALCARHVRDRASDVVCLACTELPLAFPEHQDAATFSVDGFQFINTTVAHV